MNIRQNKINLTVIAFLFLFQVAYNQEATTKQNDTLKLTDVISGVIQNNPVVKESGELINTSDLEIKMAQSAWLPIIDFNGSYSRMAPIPAFDIPGFGHIQMYPDNSMNMSLEAKQLLYDFGRTEKGVAIKQINREMAGLTAEQMKEKFALASAGIFYSLYYIQMAKSIVEEHLNTLKKHLEFVENKQKTGSATQYEILSTRVRVSAAETQLSELQTAYDVQLSHLGTIMGTDLSHVIVQADTSTTEILNVEDSVFDFAAAHRNDILILDKKKAMADMNYKLLQAQKYPSLGMFASGGWKNGYLPEIEKLEANYIIGVSLQVPIFGGNRKNIKLKMATCSIDQLNYEAENTERTVHDEINESFLQMQLSERKVQQSQIQVEQAKEAYNHAEVNFKEGVITNLDLIYASDMLAESELQLLKNKIDFKYNQLKFEDAIGEKIY